MSRSLLVLLSLCAVSLQAAAGTRASVNIGTPSISVVDLDLRDGIRAAYVEGGPIVESFSQMLDGAPQGSFAEGRARIMQDEASAIAGATHGPASTFVIVGDRYAPSTTFTVTPHSRVTISVDYRLRTSVLGEQHGPAGDPAHALASFELALMAVNNLRSNGEFGSYDYDLLAHDGTQATLDTLDGPSFAHGSRRRSGTLSLSFDNRSDSDAVFAYRGEMVAFGVSPPAGFELLAAAGVTPVPEPGSYAMMLAGLGALAWRVRRSR